MTEDPVFWAGFAGGVLAGVVVAAALVVLVLCSAPWEQS